MIHIGLDNGLYVETIVMLSYKSLDSVINVKVEFEEGGGKVKKSAWNCCGS